MSAFGHPAQFYTAQCTFYLMCENKESGSNFCKHFVDVKIAYSVDFGFDFGKLGQVFYLAWTFHFFHF